MKKERHWMWIESRTIVPPPHISYRSASIDDVPALATLMDRSYTGTIDHEGETLEQCAEEMRGTLTGKYGPYMGFASFVTEDLSSASILTLWKEKPLLAFSMTEPAAQGKGLAAFLINRSISALAEHGHKDFYLVVTRGNSAAERLYARLGFVSLGNAAGGEGPPAPPRK